MAPKDVAHKDVFEIRIAPNPPVFDLPVLVALDEGIFEKHGVKLSYAANYKDREQIASQNALKPLVRLKESLFEGGQADTYNVCEWGGVDRIERGATERAKIAALPSSRGRTGHRQFRSGIANAA